jgi:hypothetical protein
MVVYIAGLLSHKPFRRTASNRGSIVYINDGQQLAQEGLGILDRRCQVINQDLSY